MDAMGRNWWLYVWLVWLATKEASHRILTQDHRDFLCCRLPDGQAFEVIS